MNTNNQAIITGYLQDTGFRFSHIYRQERYYKAIIYVPRKNREREDYVIVFAKESALIDLPDNVKIVEIKGRFTSHDKWLYREKQHKLILYLDAETVEAREIIDFETSNNSVHLEGGICKEPYLRTTVLTKTKKADFMLAVFRENGRKEVIPCVVWGRKAEYIAKNITRGTQLRVEGRIKSRTYYKKEAPGSWIGDFKTTYEIEVNSFEIIK